MLLTCWLHFGMKLSSVKTMFWVHGSVLYLTQELTQPFMVVFNGEFIENSVTRVCNASHSAIN